MNKTYDEPLNRWALPCLKDSMALHESQLTVTHIDGATYAVPAYVAQTIENLRTVLTQSMALNDAWCNDWKVSVETNDELRDELKAARKSGEGLDNDLHKWLAALTRLRGGSQYPVPTYTADELPPVNTDILWWYPRALRGWKAGRFETDEEVAPGLLKACGYCWYLCGGRIGDGPTWWMYPPPSPVKEI